MRAIAGLGYGNVHNIRSIGSAVAAAAIRTRFIRVPPVGPALSVAAAWSGYQTARLLACLTEPMRRGRGNLMNNAINQIRSEASLSSSCPHSWQRPLSAPAYRRRLPPDVAWCN
jgi:hypothetical protein